VKVRSGLHKTVARRGDIRRTAGANPIKLVDIRQRGDIPSAISAVDPQEPRQLIGRDWHYLV
jgi:hypothetical protein